MAKKEVEELTITERAKILNAKLAPYPCTNCTKRNRSCNYIDCWKYRTWFRLKWEEETAKFKRKE